MQSRIFAIIAISLCTPCFGEDEKESRGRVHEVQEKISASFSNLNFSNITESPIKSLYAVNIGHREIYYHPETELIIFGEIFNKDGISLTQQSLNRSTLSELDSSVGLTLTSGHSKVIEFVSPDCAYCSKLNDYFQKQTDEIDSERVLVFDTRDNPFALKKAIHVLCSDQPHAALNKIYQGMNIDFEYCEEGEKEALQHRELSQKLAISATPTLVFEDGSRVIGFNQERIEQKLGL